MKRVMFVIRESAFHIWTSLLEQRFLDHLYDIIGGVTVELSRGDAAPRGWILHTCLDLHVSRCMHSGGIIPNLERSGMSNPPWMRTQGIGNYSSMIQGTNEK